MVRVELTVHGRVQGVFYRSSMQSEAQELGITGWVRNEDDGTVHAVAEGQRQALETLVAWCHEGPRAAKVEAVDTRWTHPTEEFDGFDVVS